MAREDVRKQAGTLAAAGLVAVLLALAPAAAAAWQPTREVKLMVPAGRDGGADRMARRIQHIVDKHDLMPVRLTVENREGGLGLEAYQAMARSEGDPHRLVVSLSNLFTAPRVLGFPFRWDDMTPVALLVLDQFVLWVPAASPHRSAWEYLEAAKAAGPYRFAMGGTAAKQEDELITTAFEQASGAAFMYIPFAGGGEVVRQLTAGAIGSSVSNPIEAVDMWRAGKLRPLCVLSEQRLPYHERLADDGRAWGDIPTCKEAGYDVAYEMLRCIFLPKGVGEEAVAYYADLLRRVTETPEWREFVERGAFRPAFVTGPELAARLSEADAYHERLLAGLGVIPAPDPVPAAGPLLQGQAPGAPGAAPLR
jgi:tripartite-type tricarboxylate transporter receptor subunit TctC